MASGSLFHHAKRKDLSKKYFMIYYGNYVHLQNWFDLRSLQCEWGIGLFLRAFYSFKIHFLPVKWMEMSNSFFMAQNFL